MGRIRHTPEHIAAALRQAGSGSPIVEIIRKLGVHETRFISGKRMGHVLMPLTHRTNLRYTYSSQR